MRQRRKERERASGTEGKKESIKHKKRGEGMWQRAKKRVRDSMRWKRIIKERRREKQANCTTERKKIRIFTWLKINLKTGEFFPLPLLSTKILKSLH